MCVIYCFANILWHAVNVAIGGRKVYVVLVWSWRISKRYTCTSLYIFMEDSKSQTHGSNVHFIYMYTYVTCVSYKIGLYIV